MPWESSQLTVLLFSRAALCRQRFPLLGRYVTMSEDIFGWYQWRDVSGMEWRSQAGTLSPPMHRTAPWNKEWYEPMFSQCHHWAPFSGGSVYWSAVFFFFFHCLFHLGRLMFHKQLPLILPEPAATSKLQVAIHSGICVKVVLEKKKVVLSWGKTG